MSWSSNTCHGEASPLWPRWKTRSLSQSFSWDHPKSSLTQTRERCKHMFLQIYLHITIMLNSFINIKYVYQLPTEVRTRTKRASPCFTTLANDAIKPSTNIHLKEKYTFIGRVLWFFPTSHERKIIASKKHLHVTNASLQKLWTKRITESSAATVKIHKLREVNE